MFFIDGEVRPPSLHGTGTGTGTEDYFNCAWGFPIGEYAGPYHGITLGSSVQEHFGLMGQNCGVITEHALLSVRPGMEADFELAFSTAKSIIASMQGFQGLTLSRCIESSATYLLLVEWAHLEDHTEGFRGSAEYLEWRRLLHHFYSPFPTVEHYEQVFAVPGQP